jgi:trans-2,3-dihydro-3-hydroxyanthranilate isomerase
MADLRFLQYDVFTNRPFEGNQLAVFTDGRGLDTATMQTIAREMNFSESTFIFPAERRDTDVRMRIFTPGEELPMAGHPTIGSTFALAHEGVIAGRRERFTFGLGVGPTGVELQWSDADALTFAWMDQRPPDARAVDRPEAMTRAAGVDHDAFTATGLPVEEISCGVPFVMLPVISRAAVDSAVPDPSAFRALRSAFGDRNIGILLFTAEGGTDDVTTYSRMFAPGFGILEDPATGSAAGPLGCYLVRNRLLSGDGAAKIVNLQGVAMRRPSRIHIAITGTPEAITRVQVGGQAVLVGEGKLIV